MAKEKERNQAHILYVELKKTAKEVADIVGVTEKTVSVWVLKFGWKKERNAREASAQNRVENIKRVIDSITQKRLLLSKQVDEAETKEDAETATELRKQIAQIDSGIANWNKTLENIDKENKVSLAKYLDIMQNIFDALREYNTDLFLKTLDFQDYHTHKVSENY